MKHLPFKNYMEDAVGYMLERLAPQYPDICMCDRCCTDMMMIALNNLPPRYVSTHKGDVLKRVEGMELQYEVEVLTETLRAMQIVG
ncbi:late competence development ComFB family protein, partial [Selenomonas noxia]